MVCLSVCLSVTLVSPAKTAEPIEMPSGLRTWLGPRDHVLDGGSDPPMGRGKFWRSIPERCILEALLRRVLYCTHSTQYSHLVLIVDTCLSCEDIARQSCAMVPKWQIFGNFCILHFHPAVCSTFQTCILNSHWGHTMGVPRTFK